MSRQRFIAIFIIGMAMAALTGPMVLVLRADRGGAAFGDNESFGVNRLSSATVDIEVGAQTVPMISGNLAPGDIVAGTIVVTNQGTLPLRYAVTSELTDGPVNDWVNWTFWVSADENSCSLGRTSNKILFDGVLVGGTEPSPVFGEVLVGLDPGDRILEPDSQETLCVVAAFSLDAPDHLQRLTLSHDFALVAEQHTPEPS